MSVLTMPARSMYEVYSAASLDITVASSSWVLSVFFVCGTPATAPIAPHRTSSSRLEHAG